MKKALLTLGTTLGLLFSTAVVGDERPVAGAKLIAELKEYCTEVAEEEGTDGKKMDVFMLDCINEELESEGYQPIKKLS